MIEKFLITIQDSIGFAFRGIRAQKDYIEYLVYIKQKKISVIILAHPMFREIVEETFGKIGALVIFEGYEDGIIDEQVVSDIVCKYNINKSCILTESKSIFLLKKNLKENYSIVFDNLGQAHPNPDKPSLYVRETTVEKVKNKLTNVAKQVKDVTEIQDAKVIFLPFSGLKAFGTDYGITQDEKQTLTKFMSFPFEDSIPAIRNIQKQLEKYKILVIPIPIQYGNLVEIHQIVFHLSQQHDLNPMPTSLNIDWSRDLVQQVGFFHAINQWSKETGLPNIAIVHGSACLHLVEECADPRRIIAFYATHTETIKPEDDGRIYHLEIAQKSQGWLRAIYPQIPHSHNYKFVADQIAEQAPEAVIQKFLTVS